MIASVLNHLKDFFFELIKNVDQPSLRKIIFSNGTQKSSYLKLANLMTDPMKKKSSRAYLVI